MNFIEQLFGVSPDGGDGSTELMFLSVFVLVIVLVAWRRILAFVEKTLGR